MARKSRKSIPETVSSAAVQEEIKRPFRAGLYARISTETEETIERGTIETQVELMKNYVADTEDISVAEVYKDSDYSGTNFDRPGFTQMMEDIKHGKINCVIVKDFQMAAEGMSFAEITRELNKQEIATCDEQKMSRGEQVQSRRFDTIMKKRWNPTTVSAIIRDEIYIGTRIWGKTRCSMHTGHKAVLNDESDWIRLENHHDPIVDRELFEKANRLHPKKSRGVAETRTNYTLARHKKQPALMLCAHCGHCLVRETEHLLKCSDGRTSGDHVCRSLVVRREPMEKHILELVHQFASSMLENRKIVESKNQSKDMETNVAELLKQSRQLSSEKMKLYDEYKDDRIDRELYKQKAEKIGRQLEEIRRKIAESERDAKMLEQDNTAKEMKLEEFLNMEKFDTEKLREIIKVIQVHSQEEIEIEWNFDDVFLGQR